MTTAFQASIRYPLIWIINLQSPDDFRVKRNENYRQFPRLASMRSYLLAHYLCSYQYELKQALLNGETELEIPHLLGVHVENIWFLNFHFYKKSFSEVYVDAFFRADMTAYTGSEDNPQRRSVYSDYLIRGYYDFKSSRVRLMQGIMPVSKAYPLPYTELDDYLLPKYSVSDIEEAAQEILCENYPYSIYGRINSNILAKSLELSIYKTGLGENEPDGGRFYCRDTEATLYTSKQKSFQTTVPSKTILIERSLTAQQQKNAAFHEIAHAVQHSLFYFLQEKYHEDLKENYNNTPKWLPLSNEEQKVLNRMERQADQLGFRLRIPEEGIEELTQKLMTKHSHIEDMREKLSNIIDEIADFYDITLIMARNRLIDIGYIQAKGIYDMVDGKIVPAYIPPEDMKPYQTYSISRNELLKLYYENARLRELLQTGTLVFAENHVIYNDERYVHYDKANKCGVLTEEARKNIAECCLVFTLRAAEMEYDYQFGILKRTIQHGKRRNPTVTDEDINQLLWAIEQDDDLPRRRDELKAAFSKYITERGWSNKSLADTSYFTEDRIKEIRNGNGRKVDAEEIILFGIIVNLTYTQMKEMMRIGGIGLTSSKRHMILDKILSRYEGATLEFYNGLMKRMDQAPINES